MIVDRSHWTWFQATLLMTVLATVAYLYYAWCEPNGPVGGSWQGMWFGASGTACMFFAGALSVYKSRRRRPMGRAQFWLRGHIWLGLLSVPLILFHSGFRWGGPLEQVLLTVFFIVIISGIVGLILQQVLPRIMSSSVPAQAIAEQIPVACDRLRRDVETRLQGLCHKYQTDFLAPLTASNSTAAEHVPTMELTRFYWKELQPFLQPEARSTHSFFSESFAADRLEKLKDLVVYDEFCDMVQLFQQAAQERRQLIRQSELQHWLHGWLIVHIPLSVALLVLGIMHIVMSVYY